MNALNMARTAYSSSATPTRTNQGNEYDAFSKITSRLKTAAAKGRSAFPDLIAALHENRRLWLLLATDVSNKDNQLPTELRARIYYLAEFTHVHTNRVLQKAGSADVLVDINLAVMRGLRQQGAGV